MEALHKGMYCSGRVIEGGESDGSEPKMGKIKVLFKCVELDGISELYESNVKRNLQEGYLALRVILHLYGNMVAMGRLNH